MGDAENQSAERPGGGNDHQSAVVTPTAVVSISRFRRMAGGDGCSCIGGTASPLKSGLVLPVTLRWREPANWPRKHVPNWPRGIIQESRKSLEGATFGECADRLVEAMKPSWRNPKHIAAWEMTLRDYAAPIRRLPVDKIGTDDVLSVLKPLWNEKPETASRLRGRIERVLDAAKAQGLRTGENPARWRGHLDQLLPKRQSITRGHYAADALR